MNKATTKKLRWQSYQNFHWRKCYKQLPMPKHPASSHSNLSRAYLGSLGGKAMKSKYQISQISKVDCWCSGVIFATLHFLLNL
jgi:hypothetical protein